LGTTPEEIALFFYKEERLNKYAVGEYMGEGEE
jgi:hypothetical protein